MIQLTSNDVVYHIRNRRILDCVSLEANGGEFIGLIGPNGSGKSTWLRTLCRLNNIHSGEILLNSRDLNGYTTKEIASLIAYVPQDTAIGFDFTVEDIVLMGRHAHISRFSKEGKRDYEIALKAMETTEILHLRNRSVMSLSGGQRQMVLIAKALAQDVDLYLLDEPTSALDVNRQLQVLELIKNLSNQGKTVIAALHDLNLAARFCDKLILLNHGEVLASGKPIDVINDELIQRSYRVKNEVRYDELVKAEYVTALKSVSIY